MITTVHNYIDLLSLRVLKHQIGTLTESLRLEERRGILNQNLAIALDVFETVMDMSVKRMEAENDESIRQQIIERVSIFESRLKNIIKLLLFFKS